MYQVKLSKEAYKLHEFLMLMCVGEERAMKAKELISWLGFPNTRVLRKYRAEVNSAISDIQRKVLTSNEGYYIAKNDYNAVEQYKEVAWRKIRAGVNMIQEGKRLLEHSGMDGQLRLKLTEYMKEVIEISKGE